MATDEQRAAWRKARADHARAQRQQRGKRAAPQVAGVRIPPPAPAEEMPLDVQVGRALIDAGLDQDPGLGRIRDWNISMRQRAGTDG